MRRVIFLFIILLMTSGLSAEDVSFQPLSIGLSPGIQFPLGEESGLFAPGGGA